MTEEELAGLLYDSLRNKIMPLNEGIIIYPAHGAGSACGKKMSKETTDTLGHQKAVNYALRANLSKEEFIKQVIVGLLPPPAYFPLNVMMNKQGYQSMDEVIKRGNIALTPDEFEKAANETGALILDTRNAQKFAEGFIPNSINIGIEGSFAPWVGALIPDIKQKILIVNEQGKEEEVIIRLARVGYDYTIGYLKGGFEAWKKAGKDIDVIETITAEGLASVLEANSNHVNLLDVRKSSEYESEHVVNAENAPLDFINESMRKVLKNKAYFVYCGRGYRSMIFNSILRARGYDNLIDITGGLEALKDTNRFKLTEYLCPTTLL